MVDKILTSGQIERMLRENGLKVTRARRAIIEEIFAHQEHVHPNVLLQELERKGKKVSRATLYRTLDFLIKKGLVRRMHFEARQPEYDPNYGLSEHDHLICLNCGNTVEFRDEELRSRQKEICKIFNFTPVRRYVQIFGYCQSPEKCAQEGPPRPKAPGASIWMLDA